MQFHQPPSSNRTCGFPAYGFPVVFVSSIHKVSCTVCFGIDQTMVSHPSSKRLLKTSLFYLFAIEKPAFGQQRVSNELKILTIQKQKHGVRKQMGFVKDSIEQYRMSFIGSLFEEKFTIQ